VGSVSNRLALVAVLSPRMVYSMTEWRRMRALAIAHGFEVVAWRSPTLAEGEWQSATAKAGWSVAEASMVGSVPLACLAWIGSPNHFPYSQVLNGNRVHAWPVWGVLPDAAWVESLRLRQRALAEAGTWSGQ
jgi:hypothetical protein